MLSAYINYPNSAVSVHADQDCANIRLQRKPDQRVVKLNANTLSVELAKFGAKAYRFASEQQANDMWITVEFGDFAFELAVVEYVRSLLARHYSPFKVKISQHC
jgi:hypothetical protein